MSMKKAGKSQKDIAKLLGVTEPAISQYMSQKRASTVKFSDKIKQAIGESASRISTEITLMREMQRLLHIIRNERVVCQIHEAMGSGPKNCNICFETPLIQLTK